MTKEVVLMLSRARGRQHVTPSTQKPPLPLIPLA